VGEVSVLCPDEHDARVVIALGAVDGFGVLVQPDPKPIWGNQAVGDIEAGGGQHGAEAVGS
jgi:hypothetical protein